MGQYTAYDLPIVDKKIEAHMQILKELCINALGSNLKSIVLCGSFGRGEGSVLIHPDGFVEPLRDYDVHIILEYPISKDKIRQIRSSFMRITGLGNTDEKFSGEKGFSLTLDPLIRDQLNSVFARDHDLRVYDHLYASHLVYGYDYSPPFRFPSFQIPLVNGLRLLYQKMVGLIGYFQGPYIEYTDVRRTLLYECDKTYIEICTALSLLANAYVPSYRERARWFVQNWQEKYPELAQYLPDLGIEVSRATQEKLYPKETYDLSPLEAFYNTRNALLVVYRFYIKRLYNIEVTPSKENCFRVLLALEQDYLRVAVVEWLKQRKLNNKATVWLLNKAYHRFLQYKFARGLNCPFAVSLLQIVRAGIAPYLYIFLASWCTLAAAESIPNEDLLVCTEQLLGKLPLKLLPTTYTSGWENYRKVCKQVISSYNLWEQYGT